MTVAIRDMYVRGAPLIGVAGAFGVSLAAREISESCEKVDRQSLELLEASCSNLIAARPTAVNLEWAVKNARSLIDTGTAWKVVAQQLMEHAARISEEDVRSSKAMGQSGLKLLSDLAAQKKGPINILTHCNAGWLATIDYGTATAPIYLAHEAGIDLHVWVDETRPRLQGARLTAFELAEEGIPHTIIPDSASGHLMQHGMVDICFVGTDRTTRAGDVGNKIGTYPTALAAHDNKVPFYVCAPSSSIDWSVTDGLKEIPIEQRDTEEVLQVVGESKEGNLHQVTIANPRSQAANFAFDVTPARLVSGLITERGVCEANEQALLTLFPEFK